MASKFSHDHVSKSLTPHPVPFLQDFICPDSCRLSSPERESIRLRLRNIFTVLKFSSEGSLSSIAGVQWTRAVPHITNFFVPE